MANIENIEVRGIERGRDKTLYLMLDATAAVSLLSILKKSVEIISRFIVDDITRGKLALLIKFVTKTQNTVQIEICH